MIVVDVILVVVFGLLAVYYGMRASGQRAVGDPKARWSVVAAALLALASIAWLAALIIEVS